MQGMFPFKFGLHLRKALIIVEKMLTATIRAHMPTVTHVSISPSALLSLICLFMQSKWS